MKKLIAFGLIIVAVTAVLFIYKPALDEDLPTIAIFTTLSHSALDSAREGFISALKEKQPEVLILDFNAQGSMQEANTIAHQIKSKGNVIGIFAIGSLAAQSISQVEKVKPIVVAAVSDPSILSKDKNICGLSDSIDADYQLNTIKEVLPRVKSVALLYSPAEVNSVLTVEKLLAQPNGLNLTKVGVYEPQQILNAAIDACQKNDAILIPLDNLVVASMPLVIKATKELACAVITSNEAPIHDGATLAFALDYFKSGQKAAHIFDDLIEKRVTPAIVGFVHPEKINLYLNQLVAEKKKLLVKDSGVALHRITGEK